MKNPNTEINRKQITNRWCGTGVESREAVPEVALPEDVGGRGKLQRQSVGQHQSRGKKRARGIL